MIEDQPDLTTSSNNTTDASGLYKSTDTNSGSPTYYFRGNVENNYVDFADFTWRVVRINEDGTVRLIMQDGINSSTKYLFNSNYNNYDYMYYSNSNVKTQLESWYETNITNKGYSDSIEIGNYFCEQARVKVASAYTSGNATMAVYNSGYEPDFTCKLDGNGYGVVNASVGLITYDEIVHAGGYPSTPNSSLFLCGEHSTFTMSSSGYRTTNTTATVWGFTKTGQLNYEAISTYARILRPVINLKSDVTATGSGTNTDPYKIVMPKDTNLEIGDVLTTIDGSKYDISEGSVNE